MAAGTNLAVSLRCAVSYGLGFSTSSPVDSAAKVDPNVDADRLAGRRERLGRHVLADIPVPVARERHRRLLDPALRQPVQLDLDVADPSELDPLAERGGGLRFLGQVTDHATDVSDGSCAARDHDGCAPHHRRVDPRPRC